MIKVFKEVSSLDEKCYTKYHLSEDLLMEHAALGLKNSLPKIRKKVLIVAGSGNNGADGIALARLIEDCHDSVLYIPNGVRSPMAILQLKRAKALNITIIEELEDTYDVIVDALFGSGLNRPLDKKNQSLIMILNEMKGLKISCDIPSGINREGYFEKEVFIADKTITMGAHKIALYLDKAKDYVGEIISVDLGLPSSYYQEESDTYLLEKSDMKLPHRHLQDTHKGDFGHVALIMGEKSGAAIFAAKSSFSFGAGLVTIVTKDRDNIPDEIMYDTSIPSNTTAICIGMGLGKAYTNQEIIEFLSSKDIPILIDADLFYKDIMIDLVKRKNIILTPHPKEFVALLKILQLSDISIEDLQKRRFHYTRLFSTKYPHSTLLLKGANSIIAKENRLFIQPFGTSALSKGGSGDVLAGLITALLAQGFKPLDAAITGSLAHAFASKNFTKNSYALTPNDLIEGIRCL